MQSRLFPSGARWSPACLLVVAFLLARPPGAVAQDAGGMSDRQLQVGLGILPGLGLQTGYVLPRTFYDLEGTLFIYASPRFAGGEADVQVALAFGGALRPLGIIRTIGNTGYTGYDLDVGLRLGPGLTFGLGETQADRNKRFNLLFEPYVRLTSRFGTSRRFYIEGGIQRPFLRAGLWFDL